MTKTELTVAVFGFMLGLTLAKWIVGQTSLIPFDILLLVVLFLNWRITRVYSK